MEAEARSTWVGAALIALLAALVRGLPWLKGSGNEAGFQRYAIHFERQALDGPAVGAEVTLRGIRSGRVVDHALADDKLNRCAWRFGWTAARVLDRLRNPRLRLLGPNPSQLGLGKQLPRGAARPGP